MKIKKIKLQSPALQQLKAFYGGQLGCNFIQEDEQSFSTQWGSTELSFVQAPSDAPPASYHFAFNIPENQLSSAQTWLKNKNIPLESFQEKEIIDFPNWNAHALYFTDTDQNILEFIARHDLENARSEEFGLESISEISEIGFPVPDIRPFYEVLEKNLNIPVYSHISNMTRFCAAGDEQGLFIIVPLERPWFPTSYINGIYPTEVIIQGDKNYRQSFDGLPYIIESIV